MRGQALAPDGAARASGGPGLLTDYYAAQLRAREGVHGLSSLRDSDGCQRVLAFPLWAAVGATADGGPGCITGHLGL